MGISDNTNDTIKLTIGSWNINGFGESSKAKRIRKHMHETFNILMLQETHCPNDKIRRIIEGANNHPPIILTDGTPNRAGVGTFFNPATPDLVLDRDTLQTDMEGLLFQANITWQNRKLHIINMYAPTNPNDRLTTFNNLDDLLDDCEHEIILAGDFNCLLDADMDRHNYTSPSNPDSEDKLKLRDIISKHDLVDIWRLMHPDVRQHTWHKILDHNTGEVKASRLDRFYIQRSLIPFVHSCGIEAQNISDHHIATLTLKSFTNRTKGKQPWKLNNSLLRNSNVIRKISDRLDNLAPQMETLPHDDLLKILRRPLKQAGYGKATTIRTRKASLTTKINVLTNLKYQPGIEQHALTEAYRIQTDLQRQLDQIVDYEIRGYETRGSLRRSLVEETNVIHAKKQQRRNTAHKSIHVLKDANGNFITDTQGILGIAEDFYTHLYSIKPTSREAQRTLMQDISCTPSAEDEAFMSRAFTADEIKSAINKQPTSKTPGTNGFTSEFYKQYKEQMSHWLLAQYKRCLENEELEGTMNDSLIILIHKKGEHTDLANYRPICLLNTNYKILASMLASRLKTYLPKIINPEQFGFVPGRQMEDPIRTTQMLVNLLNDTEPDKLFGIFFLDQLKAFDRVDRAYLIFCLRRFGVPEYIIKWATIIYSSNPTQISINGHTSATIDLKSGVRQGCPLSPLLYLIAIEPLARQFKKSTIYKGLTIPVGNTILIIKHLLFADDTCCAISCARDLEEITRILTLFEQASGAKINENKSEILPLGNSDWSQVVTPFKVLSNHSNTRYLGVYVGHVDHVTFWNEKIESLKSICSILLRKNHSTITRRRIAQTHIASKLFFYMKYHPISRQQLEDIAKIIQNFILGNDHSYLDRKILMLDFKHGGIALPDMVTTKEAYDIAIVKKILEQKTTWSRLTMAIINKHYKPHKPGLDILKSKELELKLSLPLLIRQPVYTFKKYEGECIEHLTSDRLRARSTRSIVKPTSLALKGLTHLHHIFNTSTSLSGPLEPRQDLSSHRQLRQKLLESTPNTLTPKLLRSKRTHEQYELFNSTPTSISLRGIHNNDATAILRVRREETLELQEFSISPSTKRTRVFPELTTTEDYHISLGEQQMTMNKFTPKKMIALLRTSNTHYHSQEWNTLDPPANWEHLPLKRIHPSLPKKLYDLRYKIMHNRLFIGTATLHVSTPAEHSDKCPFCANTVDSPRHCFLECPISRNLWNEAESLLAAALHSAAEQEAIPDTVRLLGPSRKAANSDDTINEIVGGALQYELWSCRCKHIHERLSTTPAQLKALWHEKMRRAIALTLAGSSHPQSFRYWSAGPITAPLHRLRMLLNRQAAP